MKNKSGTENGINGQGEGVQGESKTSKSTLLITLIRSLVQETRRTKRFARPDGCITIKYS